MKKALIALIGVVVGMNGLVFISTAQHPLHAGPSSTSASEEAREAASAEASTAADDAQRGLAIRVGHAIKSAVRDPDSLVIEEAWINDNASLACVVYRARNGFGGMNRETIAFRNGMPTHSPSFWNKRCTQNLNDQTFAAQFGAEHT